MDSARSGRRVLHVGSAQSERDWFITSAFAGLDTNREKVALGVLTHYHRRDGSDGISVEPRRWRASTAIDGLGLHFNCSTFRLDATDAKAVSAVRCFVVMLDDVGDIPGKSVCPLDRLMALPLKPHAYVVTRVDGEGRKNGQAFYFIVPDVIARAVALVRALSKAGWCDRHASGGVRWARPPGSIKVDRDGTRHTAVLKLFNPHLPRLTIDALASLFCVALDGERAARRTGKGGLSKPPPAEVVISAMDAIVNDFDRTVWVKIGFALKSIVGVALSDGEAFALFDDFSRQHRSYNAKNTERFWHGANPTGNAGFGTIVYYARMCGWTAAERELVDRKALASGDATAFDALVTPDEATARRAYASSGTRRVFIVPDVLLPWFAPPSEVRRVLAVAASAEDANWLADTAWRLGARGVAVRLRILNDPASAPLPPSSPKEGQSS